MTINILVVEDDENKLNDIVNSIERINKIYPEIKFAKSVDSALKCLESLSVDLLILDLNIPNRCGGKAIDSGGITILDILLEDTEGEYNRPASVFGITQHQHLSDKYGSRFRDLDFTINFYGPTSTEWRSKLSQKSRWISASKSKNSDAISPNTNLIISVHGIRTEAKWQDRLKTELVQDNEFCYSYKYGFFDLLKFLSPLTRKEEVRDFSAHVKTLLKNHPNAKISFVGHSFGTYIIGNFLRSLTAESSFKVENVLLISSVLHSNFPWILIKQKVDIKNIVNDCGTKDKVLLLSHMFVPGMGMAGRVGFKGFQGTTFVNRYFESGHNLYESVDNYFNDFCFPLFLNSEVTNIDSRKDIWMPNFINSVASWLSTKNITLIIIGVIIFYYLYN